MNETNKSSPPLKRNENNIITQTTKKVIKKNLGQKEERNQNMMIMN